MHPTETHHRFIELRAQDVSLARIAEEIQVSKPTLVAWERRFHSQIADLKAVELEALQEKRLASHAVELSRLASHLDRIETILAKRNLEVLSTEYLFCMAGALRSQIRKQRVNIVFAPGPADGQPAQPEPGWGETPSSRPTVPAPSLNHQPAATDPGTQTPDPKS